MKPLLFAAVAVGLAWVVASSLPVESNEPAGSRATRAVPAPERAPVPVLLVPGWLDTGRDLDWLEDRLVESGWPPERVRAVTFDDPAGSNRAHATELDVAARALLRRTGADSVDVVAFSMGGLATRWYLAHGNPVPVRRIAFLATPHRGTLAAHLAWGESGREMLPESGFLDSLNAVAAVPAGVEAMTVRTSIDTHVIPPESATLPGVPDHETCCPTHSGLLEDEEVLEIVRTFLERGNP